MLHLGSWFRLIKTPTVSRANGTTHPHQSSVMKEGYSLVQLGSVMIWHDWRDMEVVVDLFHASFGVMRHVNEDFTSL